MYYEYNEEKDELILTEAKRPYTSEITTVPLIMDYGEILYKKHGYKDITILKNASNYISRNTLDELNGLTELEVEISVETVGYEEKKLSNITVEVYRPRVLVSHVDKEF